MTTVPCNGCTACCRDGFIRLRPELGDDPASYLTREATYGGERVHVLQRNDDGSCIYLNSKGCQIHGNAPSVCRSFDCRDLFSKSNRDERRQQIKQRGASVQAIFAAGRVRVSPSANPVLKGTSK